MYRHSINAHFFAKKSAKTVFDVLSQTGGYDSNGHTNRNDNNKINKVPSTSSVSGMAAEVAQ